MKHILKSISDEEKAKHPLFSVITVWLFNIAIERSTIINR